MLDTDSNRESIETKVEETETNLRESYKKERQYEENKALMAIKTNPKYFYSHPQKKLKTGVESRPLEAQNGILKCIQK